MLLARNSMQITGPTAWLARRLPGLTFLHSEAFSTTLVLLQRPKAIVRKRWSQAEINQLVELRKQGETMQTLRSAFPRRTSASVENMVRRQCPRAEDGTFLYKDPRYISDLERKQILKLRAEGMPYTKIRSDYFPNRPLVALENYTVSRQVLNKRPRRWSNGEIKRLRALREEQQLPAKEVARALDRSYWSIRNMLKKIGPPNLEKRVHKWDRDARQRAIDMLQSGAQLEEVAISVYPDKDIAVVCKYLRKMYTNFLRRKG